MQNRHRNHQQLRQMQQQEYNNIGVKKYYCTIPKWFNSKFHIWWNEQFWDLCKAHDIAYRKQTGWLSADYEYAKGMYKRKYRLLAIAAFIFLQSCGWVWYFNIVKQPGWSDEIN